MRFGINAALSAGHKNRKGVLNMKKHTLCMTAMAALLPAFGLMVAGCDINVGGGGGGGTGTFVAVTNITNLPQIALANVALPLSGAVVPSNATNQTITWSGAGVANGVFETAAVGYYPVTATIANGASESSPYTKDFIITVYAVDNTGTEVGKAHGSWTKLWGDAPATLTIDKNTWTWEFSISAVTYAKGIIIFATGTEYKSQINSVMSPIDGQLHNSYSYESGNYTFTEGDSKLTITSTGSDYNEELISGTWTKLSP
jgi:hypothetical protein